MTMIMMKQTALLCLAAGCLYSSAMLHAGEASAADQALLVKLRDNNFDVRQDARKALMERGLAVRALIEGELKKENLDPDYKTHLKAIAARFKNLELLAAIDKPKRIDLEFKDRPASEAFRKIRDHFGFGVVLGEGTGKKSVSLSAKGLTFFEAVEAVRKAADLSFDTDAIKRVDQLRDRGGAAALVGDGAMPLKTSDANSGASTAAKGPVLVVIEGIKIEERGDRLEPNQKMYVVTAKVLTEPGLHCSTISLRSPEMLNAADKTQTVSGNTDMASYSRISPLLEKIDGALYSTFWTEFKLPEKPWNAASFKATVRIAIPLQITEATYTDLGEMVGKLQEFNNGSFTIRSLKGANNPCNMVFGVTGELRYTRAGECPPQEGQPRFLTAPGRTDLRPGIFVLDAKDAVQEHRQGSVRLIRNGEEVGSTFVEKPSKIFIRKIDQAAYREYEVELPIVNLPLK